MAVTLCENTNDNIIKYSNKRLYDTQKHMQLVPRMHFIHL